MHYKGSLTAQRKGSSTRYMGRNMYHKYSKGLALTMWAKLGNLLLNLYITIAITYFILMGSTTTGITGPTAMGTYLLGRYTYAVAHALFYMGGCISALMVGLLMALMLGVMVTDVRR